MNFILTEIGCSWIPPLLERLDMTMDRIRGTGETGEIKYGDGLLPPRSATEYFRQNCWVGVSGPGPADIDARYQVGIDRFMWGSDYPHDEGTWPYTREHLRQLFHDTPAVELQQLLAGNAAELATYIVEKGKPLATPAK
jgi:predicted TIM-barrel fold metal-dependent hydrolase